MPNSVEIYLRRKNKVIVEAGKETQNNLPHIGTILKNIEGMGYSFSKNLIDVLATKTLDELQTFYLDLVPVLKYLRGNHVKHNPMYSNFPKQVMETNAAELYINAIVHYWSGGKLFPHHEKQERLPLFEQGKIQFIDVGSKDEFNEIFTNLMLSKTSISQTDKDDLIWFFKNVSNYSNFLPKEIPLKENAALVGKLILKESPLATASDLSGYFKTATDVLRLITAMSDGDISLASNTKFRSFKRGERRILLDLLENCGNIEEDMLVQHKKATQCRKRTG